MKDEIPNNNWANWALLQAWFSGQCQGEKILDEHIPILRDIIIERFAQITGENHDLPVQCGPRSVVILTASGHWGRGKTLLEAAKASKSPKKDIALAFLVINDEQPGVNNYGTLVASPQSLVVSLGKIGTIGSILIANK